MMEERLGIKQQRGEEGKEERGDKYGEKLGGNE